MFQVKHKWNTNPFDCFPVIKSDCNWRITELTVISITTKWAGWAATAANDRFPDNSNPILFNSQFQLLCPMCHTVRMPLHGNTAVSNYRS